ncbi:MAG TPA: NB-ARC domain-containing protein, partial [Kofleriaceae bacterium]|nr:NB-ARC domain-containing protein [Kofleriaceae bacterium]
MTGAVVAWAASAEHAAPTPAELRDHGERIKLALESAGFAVRIEESCTPARLQAAIEAGCELLYVACHGSEGPDCYGQLELVGGMVTGSDLGTWVTNAGQHGQRVQAVVLCACASASTSADSSGMAQYVASGRDMAKASLGYRAPVMIADALPFMEALFGHLANGCSFDKAACEARRAMPAGTPDWALPLIFSCEHKPPMLGRQPEVAPVARRSTIEQPPLPAPKPYFIAREAELDALRTALATPGVQVLSAGEGGIGKTEIARVLARDAVRAGQLVLWLEKADLAPVNALVMLVQQAIPDFRAQPDTTTESLRAALCHSLGAERGLLVLDDLAASDCVELLRPSGSWSVLLTSRNATLLPGVVPHTVPPLDMATATKLLARLVYEQDALPDDHAAAATRLLEQLGGVPLLIETAAAQRRYGRDYAELVEDLRGGLGDVHSKATTLLRQSLARVPEKDRFAWYIIAALPSAGVRARNVAAALGESEAEAIWRLGRLRDRSLVRWPGDASRATMHPLARQVACELAQLAGEW